MEKHFNPYYRTSFGDLLIRRTVGKPFPLSRGLRNHHIATSFREGLFFAVLMQLLICHRRNVLVSGMNSLRIIKTLHIFKNPMFGLFPCCKGLVENQFLFDDVVKRFRTCVIITVSFSAHAGLHSILPQNGLILVRCILAPLIGLDRNGESSLVEAFSG